MNEQSGDTKRFQVKVGHATLIIEAETTEEAIQEARRLLRLEMPRMWDVIQALDANRFEVAPAA